MIALDLSAQKAFVTIFGDPIMTGITVSTSELAVFGHR